MPSATFWKRCAPLTIGSPACARASRHNHPAMTTAKSRATRTRMGTSSNAGQSTPAKGSRRPLLQGPDDADTDALGSLPAEIEKDPTHVELRTNRHRVARHIVHEPATLKERRVGV